jgi:two-component system sensor histidine kinase PilS (NtrC family)
LSAVALPPASATAIDGLAAQDEAWRALRTFGLYRILLIILLASGFWAFQDRLVIGGIYPDIASVSIILYFAAATAFLWFMRRRAPGLEIQLTLQVLIDVTALVCIMHASGGIRSGLGILLMAPIAASSLITRGRMLYFHAAVAVIGLLLEQALQWVRVESSAGELLQAGLLSAGYFAIAALTSAFARYARGVERIAEERGVDLANMSQINELVIRDMQDGFLVVDENGVIRQHNPQCEELLGAIGGRDRLADYSPRLAIHLREWRADPGRVFPVMHEPVTQKDCQIRFVAIGRGRKPGGPAPTVIFVEDVGRIRAQAQQMKLVALGRLTASIAHEIRNPLSSINHASELLQEDEGRNADDMRLLGIIRDNAHRLDRMVQEVLYLNRRDRAQPEAIGAESYLKQFVHEFSGNERVPPGIVVTEIHSLRRLWFDRTHLDQVLWNLARNAWRYCHKQPGSVCIALFEGATPDTLMLEVKDDGPGVAISSLPHLFEPFFTTDSQGTGLGLYIARELAEVNGARLEYVVRDRGACFRVTLHAANAVPNL